MSDDKAKPNNLKSQRVMTEWLDYYENIDSDPDAIRKYVAIAIDGGGIKGAIVARGLLALERLAGQEGKPLREWDKLKVVTGTSTGALIASAIAAGYTAAEISNLYETLSERAFDKRGPIRPFGKRWLWPINPVLRLLPKSLKHIILRPYQYEFDPLREIILDEFANLPNFPGPSPSLEQVGDYLRQNHGGDDALTLILTAVDVLGKRTHFLKTTPTENAPQKTIRLVDAMLASSCIPTYFPPVLLQIDAGKLNYCVDGGVGSFGNPSYVAAWEMCDESNPHYVMHGIRRYPPKDVTVFSLGTGIYQRDLSVEPSPPIARWWAEQWLPTALDLFGASAQRHQSRTIISSYEDIDLRRFQFVLPEEIGADDVKLLQKPWFDNVCNDFRDQIFNNHNALKSDAYDPEGIRKILV